MVRSARSSSIGPGTMRRMTRLNVKDRTYAEFSGLIRPDARRSRRTAPEGAAGPLKLAVQNVAFKATRNARGEPGEMLLSLWADA